MQEITKHLFLWITYGAELNSDAGNCVDRFTGNSQKSRRGRFRTDETTRGGDDRSRVAGLHKSDGSRFARILTKLRSAPETMVDRMLIICSLYYWVSRQVQRSSCPEGGSSIRDRHELPLTNSFWFANVDFPSFGVIGERVFFRINLLYQLYCSI